ncbi:MAG: MFS transporter [Ruminococcaceae bacterium]|nr:MFS transporter [Oscillospiraceae bacterium]
MKKQLSSYEKKSWQLVILCLIAYTVVYIGKKNINVCLPGMIADGICDNVQGGTIGTCFLALYAAGQFINGWLGEKIHPRYMICGGLLLAGIMNVLMGTAQNSIMLMIIWGACGFFCSMLWPPIIRAVSTWTTPEISRSSAATLAVTIPVGTILADLVCAAALKLSGWRAAFAACGIILVVISVGLYIGFMALKSHTAEKTEVSAEDVPEEAVKPVAHSGVKILCAGIIFTGFAIVFNGMIKDGLDLWIPTVLTEQFVIDAEVASVIVTVLPIFNIAGVYFAKFIFSKFGMTELGCCALMFAISTVSLGVVLVLMKTAATGLFTAILVTVLLACSSASMLGANTMILNFIPLHFAKIGRASFISGTLNCFSYAAAAVSSIAIGAVSEAFEWTGVFVVFVVAALLGLVFSFIGKGGLAKKNKELDEL